MFMFPNLLKGCNSYDFYCIRQQKKASIERDQQIARPDKTILNLNSNPFPQWDAIVTTISDVICPPRKLQVGSTAGKNKTMDIKAEFLGFAPTRRRKNVS